MDTTRRSFIGGIVASIAGGEALIKLATADETSILAVDQPVDLIPQPQCIAYNPNTGERCKMRAVMGGDLCQPHGGRRLVNFPLIGEVLFIQQGEIGFVPIGVVSKYHHPMRNPIDVTSLSDHLRSSRFVAGPLEITGEFVLYGTANVRMVSANDPRR